MVYHFQLFGRNVIAPFFPAGATSSSESVDWAVTESKDNIGFQNTDVIAQDPFLTIWLSGDEYTLNFHTQAAFSVNFATSRIDFVLEQNQSLDVANHLFTTHVLPRCLAREGLFPLHASAVAHSDVTIAFIGASGAGKSTLAYEFERQGAHLVCDDGLVVEGDSAGTVMVPGPSVSRLWHDSMKALAVPISDARSAHRAGKYYVPSDSTDVMHIPPLRALFVLEPVSAEISPTATRLSTAEALVELIRATLRLDRDDPAESANTFRWSADLIRSIPFYRLAVPRDFKRLPEVTQLVLDTCAI